MHGRVWPTCAARLGRSVEELRQWSAPTHTRTHLALPQVAFEEGRVATPELTADLQLPSSLDVLGQRVDLAPLQVRSWLLSPRRGLYCVPWVWGQLMGHSALHGCLPPCLNLC